MSLSRRHLLQRSAGTALVLAAGSRSSALAQDKQEVTVKLWVHDQGTIDFFQRRADELTTSPDSPYAYTMEFTQASTIDVVTKALAAWATGGNAPDLIGIEISEFSRFMQGGVAAGTLLDITDRVAPIRDQFFESRWTPYAVDGRQYGVETGYGLSVYYYRDDLFKELGITTPIETWEQLVDVGSSAAVPKGMAINAVSAGGPSGVDVSTYGILLQQRGGAFFDAAGQLTLDSPEAVEVLQFIVDRLADGTFLGLTDFYGAGGAAAMAQGKTLGYAMPEWFLTYILKPSVPDQAGAWRMQPIPKFSAGGVRTSTWGGLGFAVSKDSDVADAAWALLEAGFLTREGQIKRWEEIRYLPTMKDVWSDPVMEAPEPFLGGQQPGLVFREIADEVPTQHQSPYWSVMVTELGGQLAEVYGGRKSAADGIKDAAAAIRAEIQEG